MSADVKLLGETSLGGKPVSRFVFFPEDQRLDLIHGVFVKPDAADRLEQDLMLPPERDRGIRQRKNVRGTDRSLTHTDPFDIFPGRELRRQKKSPKGDLSARDGQVV
jgi:hypothetical protein